MHVQEVAVAEAAVEAEAVLPVIHRLHKDRPAPIDVYKRQVLG